jgi:hypothetical protein
MLLEATIYINLKNECTNMNNTKKKIMSLSLVVGMVFSLGARSMCIGKVST